MTTVTSTDDPIDRLPAAGGDVAPGGADLNPHQPHRFRLAASAPDTYDGGTLRNASEETFSILKGQDASVVLAHLEPGGIREPHWHPSAWEVNYVITGRLRFTALETLGYWESFDAEAGDLVFLPQGGMHYFENVGEDVASSLIVFNSSSREPRDDIGMVSALSVLASSVLGSLFGVPAEVFDRIPHNVRRIGITRHTPR
ncbi:cupin domain-containing protein [Pseudonocardia nantongensis]|uniref:cupin domain-containing protein n=1 Tax=Pseudonocardia nantongensis TaxID=1181885 RepID=UPI00397C9779